MNGGKVIFSVMYILVQCTQFSTAKCGSSTVTSYVFIPDTQALMSIPEFDHFIINRQMGEAYFAVPKPAAFLPDIHYFVTINKVIGSSNYNRSSFGESVGENAKCVRSKLLLKAISDSNRAMFMRGDTQSGLFYWSSCPATYMWSMRCDNYYVGEQLCALADTQLGVYVHGSLDDAPLIDIIQDLFTATGVKFGDTKFKWFFDYGKTSLC